MNKILLASVLSCTLVLMTSTTFANDSTEEIVSNNTTGTELTKPKVPTGKEVYETYCMACHAIKGKATVAPPIFAVKNHVIQVYPKREEFVERVVSWVKSPDVEDPLMRGAVRKFGLMPSMPHISDTELTAVAEFLYDSDMALPEWYKKHYKEEHGEEPKSSSLQ